MNKIDHKAHYRKYKSQQLAYKKAYYAANKVSILAKQYEIYQKDPLHDHGKKIKKRYGISKDDYAALLVRQHNKCAICHTPETSLKRRLGVDHCHKTGKIRGLLCDKCNSMLGHANDSIEFLQRGIEYLTTGASDMIADEQS